jgi:hypothetical protein
MFVQLESDDFNLHHETGVVGRFKHDVDSVMYDLSGTIYRGEFTRSPSILLVTIGNEQAQVSRCITLSLLIVYLLSVCIYPVGHHR